MPIRIPHFVDSGAAVAGIAFGHRRSSRYPVVKFQLQPISFSCSAWNI